MPQAESRKLEQFVGVKASQAEKRLGYEPGHPKTESDRCFVGDRWCLRPGSCTLLRETAFFSAALPSEELRLRELSLLMARSARSGTRT